MTVPARLPCAPGSVGAGTTPGKVWKGKHLPGHYGTDQVTIQNLFVAGVEAETNVLLVSIDTLRAEIAGLV